MKTEFTELKLDKNLILINSREGKSIKIPKGKKVKVKIEEFENGDKHYTYYQYINNSHYYYIELRKKSNFDLGKNHKPFIKVMKGGSSCSNCKWISKDKKRCENELFINFYGKAELPQPVDSYCSDWYVPSSPSIQSENEKEKSI